MLFSSPVLFELPVLPRVQKYLRLKLTDASGESHPLLATPETPGPGQLIWMMAQTDKKELIVEYSPRGKQPAQGDQRAASKRVYFEQRLTAEIGVGIQQFHYRRHQYLLNMVELEIFSNQIDYLILNEAVWFCQQAPQTPPMTRIKAFCDQYDFAPGELGEEALRQMYLRHRKQKAASAYSSALFDQYQFKPCLLAA